MEESGPGAPGDLRCPPELAGMQDPCPPVDPGEYISLLRKVTRSFPQGGSPAPAKPQGGSSGPFLSLANLG